MMRLTAFAIILLCSWQAHAQSEVKVFAEKEPKGFVIYASNEFYCPASLMLNLELEGMVTVGDIPKVFVVPARADKFRLIEIKAKETATKISYVSRFMFVMGDISLSKHDSTVLYDLPFANGKRFMVHQGYNGQASHRNIKALDFSMPVGTDVLAARDGVVVKVAEDNDQACPEEQCAKFNNYVLLFHDDGSFSEYVHLSKGGALVDPGDKVKQGDLIARSGNTGWTSGPHLHFCAFMQKIDHRVTLATRFRTGNGQVSEMLAEKSWYDRKY